MKYALTSINPPNTDNIFDGVKGIEWRTKPLPTGLHYCYETKNLGGVGKVIGEFTVWRIKRYQNASFVPETEIDLGCVPKEFLMAYSKGKPIYANYIVKPKRYDKPKELSDFIIPSKIGCCNDGKCRGCRWFDRGNGFNVEDDCNAPFCTDEYKPLRKAPQSWCYVEEVRNG